jgi:uncharacterized iron-regulated membrane protein
MTYLRRRLGHVQYCGTWETQERGVLHRHVIIRVRPGLTERRVRAAVRNTARRWGFGSQYQCDPVSSEAAAWYVAKYVAKESDVSAATVRLDHSTGELVRGRRYRPWSASREWGDTMTVVRARQRAYHLGRVTPEGSAGPGGAAGVALDLHTERSTPAPDLVVVVPPAGRELLPV